MKGRTRRRFTTSPRTRSTQIPSRNSTSSYMPEADPMHHRFITTIAGAALFALAGCCDKVHHTKATTQPIAHAPAFPPAPAMSPEEARRAEADAATRRQLAQPLDRFVV